MASSDDTERTDELASAYLDGELGEAERAVVEGDSALLARVQELRAAAAAVAGPTPGLHPGERDDLVARALQAGAVPAPRRPSWRSRLPSPATAAAALLVVLLTGLALVFVTQLGSGGDDDAASDAGGSGAAAEQDVQESQEKAPTSTSAADSSTADPLASALALGEYTTDDALRAALGRVELERLDRDFRSDRAGSALGPSLDRCADAVGAQLAEPGRLTGAGTATVAGEPVLVFHHRLDGGGDQLSVADPVTCAIRFAVQR